MLRLDLLASGATKDVYALVVGSRCETRDFLDSLPVGVLDKVRAVFQRLGDLGCAGYKQNVVRHLQGRVFEIKEQTTNRRLFGFMWGQRMVVCTHADRKPAGKSGYGREIDRVNRLMEMCEQEGVLT